MTQDQANYYFATLQAGLQTRTVVTPLPEILRPWQAVYLQSGVLQVSDHGAEREAQNLTMEAPALVCWPAGTQKDFHLLAGSTGVHLAIGEMFLVAVLGKRPEAGELRDAVMHFATLALDGKPREEARISAILTEISEEHDSSNAGRLFVIEAQLRCLLVHLWRHAHRASESSNAQGQQTLLLRKFRQLVEAHFHDRWRVQDYAHALNVTADRLHNISTNVLGKTPMQLIHERSHREACALLIRTNMTLDQIAAHLNFKSTPQFSAFFRKSEGIPPGKFRSLIAETPESTAAAKSVNFSDWP